MTKYYDFEVALLGAEPQVWRRFLKDSGGLHGFQDCVKVVQGFGGRTRFGSASEARSWLGDWDPERFDLASAKKIFDR